MTLKYLDLDGDPALLEERKDGRAYGYVKYDDGEWMKVHVAVVINSAREIGEEKFKKRFEDAGMPEGLEA